MPFKQVRKQPQSDRSSPFSEVAQVGDGRVDSGSIREGILGEGG